jgi:DNA replication licensing factor MCM5
VTVSQVRVRIVGIYSIFTAQARGSSEKLGSGAIAVKQTYLRVIGLQDLPSPASGRSASSEFTSEEEATFRAMSMAPDIYERISRSIAPSIYGLEDQKKAVACLLFGGARKKLPDGMNLRGDINVLFLGDPATAKSQLLKFAERVAPICIYTSGKGSSAAGLTGDIPAARELNYNARSDPFAASVVRDTGTGEWQLEAGAMVLADGGVVCIDEFDKMREEVFRCLNANSRASAYAVLPTFSPRIALQFTKRWSSRRSALQRPALQPF